jgi:MFS family permease
MRKALRQTRDILRGFKGNSRACLMVEPMWGIPFNLYTPYTSLYMLALGCSAAQVGLITTVGLVFHMAFSLVSGHITDRLGRRRTSLIFDLIGWSIPTLIWAVAGGFQYFLVAAIINAAYRVVHTSWNCLLIEDSPASQRIHIYTWVQVAGILAGFVAPLAGLLVGRFGLVPAVRGLYVFAFLSMTSMFLIRNRNTTETRMGLRKMQETANTPLRESLGDYGRVFRELLRSPYVLIAFLLHVLNQIQLVIQRTFVGILLTRGLGFSESVVGVFPAIHSVVMLTVFVFVMPAVSRLNVTRAVRLGFAGSIAGFLVFVLSPSAHFVAAIAATVLTAFGMAVVFPTVESLLTNAIVDVDRAKVMAILNVFLFGVSAPFGYLGGLLAEQNARLPFVLVLGLLALAVGIVGFLGRHSRPQFAVETAE